MRNIVCADDHSETKHCSDEYVSTDQRISKTSRQNATPRNDPSGPESSHKRFERQIDHSEEERPEQHVLHALNEVKRLLFRDYVMRGEQPAHKTDYDESSEAKCSFAIAAT